jgi:hypothetical protein
MRRFLLTVATAASVLAVASCSDISGIGGDPAGTYELETIDGQQLPETVPDPDEEFGTITVGYGEIQLDNDGTFIDMYQFTTPGSSLTRTRELSGTWEHDGGRIRFDANNGATYFMDRTSGNRLAYEDPDDGLRWVYDQF